MNFILLHGLDGSSKSHWFPWLKNQLEAQGHSVWLPDLPHSSLPAERVWTPFIMAGSPFSFDQNLVIVGWSAGAVEALHLLSQITRPIRGAILLSAFITDLGWASLGSMFEREFDLAAIKRSGGKLIFMHGTNDPHCPLKDVQYLAKQTGAQLKVVRGAGHFSTNADPRFIELPELLPAIREIIA